MRTQVQGILRDEWGFTGAVTTDWNTPSDHANCVLAGNDVRMPTGDPDNLREALSSGRLHREHLELCAKRLLELFLKFD